MPVYERRYRDWAGERRPPRAAVAVVARHALADIFAARLNLLLFVVACLPFVVFATVIWVAHSVDVLALLQVRDPERLRTGLEGGLFFWFLMWQSSFAFLLASFAGPGLIAPDVAHGALPLYLARPLGRTGYVAGKLAALLAVLSAVTWVPGLLLVVLEGSLSGGDWFLRHARVPAALFVGSWIWILLLALAALAISAWVRWRPLATGGLFILFVVGSAFGGVINATLDTRWGKLLMAGELVQAIWSWLFGDIVLFGRHWPQDPLPLAVCWLALGVFAALALAVLHRRIRALEVVR
jgi:ABC-type transport system involved in multi-copper enzyme maturation permease subunit